MSLEQAIQENTAAVNKLIDLFSSGKAFIAAPVTEAKTNDAPVTLAKAKPKAPEPEAQAAASATTAQAVVEGQAEEPAIGYELVRKTTMDLQRVKGRDTVIEILASFNATKATELNTEDYAAYVAACGKAMA